ncbi:MAG TPA: RDD family protein [Candidatus Dormibacteraeota bacterium]|nr:RDD family protein [Candidatus Dormibacteraeota bacterium]
MDWKDGRVSLTDSVAAPRPLSGRALRDSFVADVPRLTFGLVRVRGNSLTLGPIDLLRFGRPRVSRTAVEWPIEGGLGARARGGTWRIQSSGDRIVASIDSYRPMLPRFLYAFGQLPVHLLFTRLYLLRTRGREPAPGTTASSSDRMRATAIDVAFCAVLTGLVARKPRVRMMLGVIAGYHVTCWTLSGQTLGGLAMRQRVVATDGSTLTVWQSLLRLLALPVSWLRGRPDHDEIACTDVIDVHP